MVVQFVRSYFTFSPFVSHARPSQQAYLCALCWYGRTVSSSPKCYHFLSICIKWYFSTYFCLCWVCKLFSLSFYTFSLILFALFLFLYFFLSISFSPFLFLYFFFSISFSLFLFLYFFFSISLYLQVVVLSSAQQQKQNIYGIDWPMKRKVKQ